MTVERTVRRTDMTPSSYEPRMPPKRSEVVAQRIVRDIRVSGKVAGDSLETEAQLCETYQVGRSTVREALRLLELQGVIQIRPGRGGGPIVSVPNSRHLASTLALLMQFSETTFRTVVETRGQIEPFSASLCAQHRDDELLRGLEGSVGRMAEGINDEIVFLDENQRFHTLVAEGAKNPIISFITNSLDWVIDGSTLGIKFTKTDRRSVLKAHREICEAIASGDSDDAYEAMKRHLSDTARYFEKKFPDVMSQVVTWELYGL